MGEKVRILGIAPYKGLVTLMKRYAGQRDDIQLTAMLGNVETGLSLAKEHYRNYDIIISRANTASRIAKGVPIPVIDIGIDYYDVLLCLKTAAIKALSNQKIQIQERRRHRKRRFRRWTR